MADVEDEFDEEENEQEATGVFEPCSAMQCSECGGIVTTELNDLEHGKDNGDKEGETLYECPHCGSWNTAG